MTSVAGFSSVPPAGVRASTARASAEAEELAASAVSAIPATADRECGFCGQPWFGIVAFCPYCGREPGALKESAPPETGRAKEATDPGRAWRMPSLRIPRFRIPTLRVPNLWMPKREDRAPSDAPSSGKPSSTPWHAPRATPLVKGVITGFAAIAVVWIGVLVVAPGAGSLASAKLAGLSGAAAHDARAGARSLEAEPASAAPDSTVPAGPGPALAAAPRPKHAPTSATAAAAVPPAARPHPNRSLCSVADEAANLCKLQ